MKVSDSTRRQFIKTSSLGVAAFTIVPRHVLGGPGFVPPSDKVYVALVGAGGMARNNLLELFKLDDVQVISVADPAGMYSLEHTYYKGSGGRAPAKKLVEDNYVKRGGNFRCSVYEDFRVMLEREKAVDAVLCATPDHLHAYVSVLAMRAGKHIYCEKPMTHNLWETRLVARVARETGRATQMGNRGSSQVGIRETIEYLRDGAIGEVREIHVWTPATRYGADLLGRPVGDEVVPNDLNWDLWLGPREWRSFHADYHPFTWRDFWAFGSGAMGDFGCHDLNAPVWAFDLPFPSRVSAYPAGLMNDEIVPPGTIMHFEFAPNSQRPAIKLTWYDGGLRPSKPHELGSFPLPPRGALYCGEKGVIQTDASGTAPRLFPESLRRKYQKPKPALKRSGGHHRDWIDACKGGDLAASHFEKSAHLTAITQLGLLSLRTRKPIEWDSEKQEARGVPEAGAIIRGSYRRGWEPA